mmetsp:Transcript_72490/g.128067  ORF Transcript_72490/g.128067 Transcript_72490/m.128067 type:complete len:547 (-) Transcript_72490:64-1704(-)|eukprot:CAMPEP_0197628378 /NCGR_PEP_ID=MMETSP1338-20131121/6710_1 /TAXON_ID=43686 ORGANISM="Pelagodinium beii, Strain RCC1491" /NCGR_SAMPLE_ID=MMETSP1338 /ASSEMBLY_ACC=CAM_ASM_000754 /LENGTH=546 /DNA_ID=CAMNT_0043199341 /DNA_START=66 /DNA_END=1706 /DNA_ORIENTATION=+
MRFHLFLLVLVGLCSVYAAKEESEEAVSAEAQEKEVVEEGEKEEEAEEEEEEELEGEEGEHGEEGEEGEEEEEEEVSPIDVASACYLLGGVAFVISLFYAVNHSDRDIREHSWKVISETISIFVSVLLFQAISGVFDKLLMDNMGHLVESMNVVQICIAYVEFAIFYCSLHMTMNAYAYWKNDAKKSDHVFEEKRELKMATWSKLFGHMSGFAVIRCILNLQEVYPFKTSPWIGLTPVLLNALLLFGLFRLADYIRSRPPYFVHGQDNEGYYRWEEGAEESENDLCSIGLSFTIVVAIRYMISGCLVNLLGVEDTPEEHEMTEKIQIGVLSLLFAIMSATVIVIDAMMHKKKEGENRDTGHLALVQNPESGVEHFSEYVRRWVFIGSSTLATMAAWCAMYFAKWNLHSFLISYTDFHNPNSCVARVILSMVVSAGTFMLIFLLDKLKDMDCTKESADTAIKSIIQALAILIGFTWESAFDAGVEALSELTAHNGEWCPVFVKLLMAVTIALVSIPAWRKYILPHTLGKQPISPTNDDTVPILPAHQ